MEQITKNPVAQTEQIFGNLLRSCVLQVLSLFLFFLSGCS